MLQVVIASEATTVGTEDDGSAVSFTAVLAVPCVAFDSVALQAACGGSADLAEGVTTYLASRCGRPAGLEEGQERGLGGA